MPGVRASPLARRAAVLDIETGRPRGTSPGRGTYQPSERRVRPRQRVASDPRSPARRNGAMRRVQAMTTTWARLAPHMGSLRRKTSWRS